MLFSKDFFALNLTFAKRISAITSETLQQSLLNYTHLYLAFGLGRDFNPANRIWQSYLHNLREGQDLDAYTHEFYLTQQAKQPKNEPENAFGCFSYVLWEGNRVRLHFRNAMKERGILGRHNVPERIAELRSMFEHLHAIVPVTSTVVGSSWLYNVEAYRRLFPEPYLKSASTSNDEFQFIALWGQFLCYDGSVREPLAHMFLEGIEKQETLSGVESQFPYQVLRLESSIQDFCAYFCID
jgi:hypothetical protein